MKEWVLHYKEAIRISLLALACGLSYMFSGYHSLYSSQGFRTSKLFSEFLQPKEEK